MAISDLYLRSDVDKSETSPDSDLRLRSDADKVPAGGLNIDAVMGISWANLSELIGITKINIDEVMGITTS